MDKDQVIFINKRLQTTLYVFLFVNALGIIGVYYVLQLNSSLFGGLSSPLFYGLYGLFFVGTLLLNLINKNKKIIFSTKDQCVYSQTILGKKRLTAFGDIGAIKPYGTGYGATYFGLFDKANLFGRNPIRISPNYSPGAKDARLYAEFERTVLPKLQAIISQNNATIPNNIQTVNEFNLTYYTKQAGTYWLKHTYHRDRMSYVYIAGLLAIAFLILVTPGIRLRYINFGIGAGVGAGIMAFLLTEKTYFQGGKLISEYTNGLFRRVYPLILFETFQIIHRKYNFIYVGTDVNMLINNKPVFLCQVRKSEHIEKLINETNYIVEQQLPRAAS